MCKCFHYSLQVKKQLICVIIIDAKWKCLRALNIYRDEVFDFQSGLSIKFVFLLGLVYIRGWGIIAS